jgi:hypothetical protein
VYGVIGEEESDAEVIKVLVRKLKNSQTLKFLCKGFCGDGELLKNGAKNLRAFKTQGCDKFVVCYDADGPDPAKRHEAVVKKIIEAAEIASEYFVVIPVQEIEAWILADIQAVTKVFTSWKPDPIKENPEGITNPKERLISENRKYFGKPKYTPSVHNPRVAEHLDLHTVRKRCPSFEKFAFWITGKTVSSGEHKPV